ncbi:ABC transporter ATP-binding protein [Lusitaniella coriacea LEGE 07157]|uniref:ABC transporter ATP-binding protein n=1 Tax=Lusitaniella coriacea LEGE 07157 TaxID=945747 RepID=A0A8J7DVX5_9CYAN|nr:ABC transporter ATP-binding protein [Lusitaniella coriacea LEGE 07157]
MILNRLLSLKQALSLCWQSSRNWTLASIILLVIRSFLPVASLYLAKRIVDALTQALTAKNSPTAFQEVFYLIVLTAAVTILNDLCGSLVGVVQETQSQVVTDYVQNLLHAKSIAVDLEYYENAQYYDRLHQAQSEAPYRPSLILNRLLQALQGGISLGAIALLLIALHWGITLILFLAIIPLLLVRLQSSKQFYRLWQQWTAQERRAQYYSELLTRESHAKEIRLFQLGTYFQNHFKHLRKEIHQGKLRLAWQRFRTEAIAQSIATLAIFAAFAVIARQTLQGALSLGSLVMYYQAFQRGQGLLRDTTRNLASLYENSLFLSNFYNFLHLKPLVLDPPFPRPIPNPLQVGIAFENVSFRYPHSQRSVLEAVSFQIEAGETVAFVGENGAGKSTLIKLLCRLYDPCGGKITWDGIDVEEFSTTELRGQMGVVFQDYARYNLTVRENIGFGNGEKAAIHQAACLAGVDRAIARLPNGYDTTLGHQFDRGEELSIGEWQKIAIARCLLRQAQILILDEPTSALDPQAEAEILQKFNQLTQNRTAILISHRLSTVQFADRIFVLEQGKIAESGTHQNLLQQQGTYARLFNTQAYYYQ